MQEEDYFDFVGLLNCLCHTGKAEEIYPTNKSLRRVYNNVEKIWKFNGTLDTYCCSFTLQVEFSNELQNNPYFYTDWM